MEKSNIDKKEFASEMFPVVNLDDDKLSKYKAIPYSPNFKKSSCTYNLNIRLQHATISRNR